ncbi:substrate-binding domain-containing protein [Faecalicatena contorta]|uniref:substrate-binding domain-containing protein n=1 Tax=Faecalicatena contorta TaxID=39482 RepID=UPI0019606E6B|nr:substrate-binding domain-containing protein [Faecalicatena contorta]MBM6684516.1 substrate-binding domain-containing protein [Faecalicatena contorta]MBM6709171.1 substrate-binding domain-containing protein [Faecalicatena contorta]
MRKKIIGLVLLICVMAAVGGIYLLTGGSGDGEKKETGKTQPRTAVSGYVGGEKIGFLEDEEVLSILGEKYGLEVDYSKAGSLDMMTVDLEGRNYLFPSSSIALEYYEELHGSPVQSEILLNTPIVLYTHKMVLDAFDSQGLITKDGDVNYIDMAKLVELIQNDTAWADIGVPELYGTVSVDTTDPARSNSGNMFAALLADVLNGGQTLTPEKVDEILPQLQTIFGKLGYMETSSSDLFSQFLRMGVGATPIAAGYESQIIEYAMLHPEEYESVRDDIVVLYPAPTVWSAHVLIALDDAGKTLIRGLQDEEVQKLAWEKHGFRTGNYEISDKELGVPGIADNITQVAQVPSYDVMRRIIDGLR